jgi:hypothetical protein
MEDDNSTQQSGADGQHSANVPSNQNTSRPTIVSVTLPEGYLQSSARVLREIASQRSATTRRGQQR